MRVQYSIATALYVVTAAAILFAVARWERELPYEVILPSLILGGAYVLARRGQFDLAWAGIALGLLVAFVFAIDNVIAAFSYISHQSQLEVRRDAGRGVVTAIALPLWLAVPAVALITRPASRAARWLAACMVIALLDVVILTVSLMVFIGWRR